MRGGKRTGAGRPRGRRNRKTEERLEAVAASGQTPLEYLLEVMRSNGDPSIRLDAAKAAAPYCHPKLSQSDINVTADLRKMTDEQLNDELGSLLEDPEIASVVARARAAK